MHFIQELMERLVPNQAPAPIQTPRSHRDAGTVPAWLPHAGGSGNGCRCLLCGGCWRVSFAEQPRLVLGAASEEEAGVVPSAVNYPR